MAVGCNPGRQNHRQCAILGDFIHSDKTYLRLHRRRAGYQHEFSTLFHLSLSKCRLGIKRLPFVDDLLEADCYARSLLYLVHEFPNGLILLTDKVVRLLPMLHRNLHIIAALEFRAGDLFCMIPFISIITLQSIPGLCLLSHFTCDFRDLFRR